MLSNLLDTLYVSLVARRVPYDGRRSHIRMIDRKEAAGKARVDAAFNREKLACATSGRWTFTIKPTYSICRCYRNGTRDNTSPVNRENDDVCCGTIRMHPRQNLKLCRRVGTNASHINQIVTMLPTRQHQNKRASAALLAMSEGAAPKYSGINLRLAMLVHIQTTYDIELDVLCQRLRIQDQ